jgi:ParB-like nuclease domain
MITLAPRPRAAPKKSTVALDQIDFPANARPTHADKVRELANSIRRLGLQTLPTVVERDGRYMLIAGRHRVEALRVIGRDPIDVRVVDFDDIEARLWTISENLHRNELNALQRSEHIAEWIRLTEASQSSQVETAVLPDGATAPEKVRQLDAVYAGGRGNIGGVRAAARELGITEPEARRSVKIDSITPEAKEAAYEAGLDRNQSALLKVASYANEDQVEAVADIAKARNEKAQAAAELSVKSLRNLECLSAGEFARWIKLTTPNDRTRVIRMLVQCAVVLNDELPAGHRMGLGSMIAMAGQDLEALHA